VTHFMEMSGARELEHHCESNARRVHPGGKIQNAKSAKTTEEQKRHDEHEKNQHQNAGEARARG